MELSQELKDLKERWREHGFLLKGQDNDKSFGFTLFGRYYLFGYGKSSLGWWDDYSATGSVYTNGLTFRKCRHIDSDGEVLVIYQAIISKFIFSFASVKVV